MDSKIPTIQRPAQRAGYSNQPTKYPVAKKLAETAQRIGVAPELDLSNLKQLIAKYLFGKDDAVTAFRKVALADPQTATIGEKVLEAYGDKVRIDGMSEDTLVRRLTNLPFFAAPDDVRRAYVESIQDALNDRSAGLLKTLRGTPERNAVWDVVAIGAGPHNAGALYDLAQATPEVRALAIEASDTPSANFSLSGEGFYLNSSNRQDDGSNPKPGQGNLNQVGGPVGVPDTSGKKFPPAVSVGQAAAVALYESNADVLMNSRVVKVESRENAPDGASWPARYRVTFRPKDVGTDLAVYANKLAVATGLAQVDLRFSPETNALVKSELDQADRDIENGKTPSGIFTTAQALRAAQKSDVPRAGFRDYELEGKPAKVVTAVIGGGDSSRTFIEQLYGTGPDEQYDEKLDRAALGQTGPTLWFTGSNGPASREDLINTSRPRYADLVGFVRGRERDVTPLQGSVTKIEKRPAKKGSGFVYDLTLKTDSGEQVFTVDRVVLGAGLTTNAGPLLKSVLPREYDDSKPLDRSSYVEKVTGKFIGSPDEDVPLALRLRDQDILLFGPAAGTDVVTERETAGITQNRASLYALNPRTRAAAVKFLQANAPLPAKALFPTQTYPSISGYNLVTGTLAERESLEDVPVPQGFDDLRLKAELARVLSKLNLPSNNLTPISLTFRRDNGKLQLQTNLGMPGFNAFVEAVRRDRTLRQLLSVFTSAKATLQVTASSEPNPDSTSQLRQISLPSLTILKQGTLNWT